MAYHINKTFRPLPFVLLMISVTTLHAAANLLNDIIDFDRGFDRQVYPGSGAVVRQWITVTQARRVAYLLLSVGIACGVVLLSLCGIGLLLPGIIGVALAIGYTRSGTCLKTLGLGDASVFTAFGLLPVLTAWWVQTGHLAWSVFWWSLPIAFFSVAILHANNWRDLQSDARLDCKSLAVRLGERHSSTYYKILLMLPFVLVAGYVAVGTFTTLWAPFATLATLIALPASMRCLVQSHHPSEAFLQTLDVRTAQLHMGFSLLLLVGLLVSLFF